jgi:hypothetical protein
MRASSVKGFLWLLVVSGCGSVTPLAVDGGAGASGHGGASGVAGQSGASGAAGQGGASGSAGHGGASGVAGQGGAGSGGGRDGGADVGGNPCHGLTEVQCGATPGCQAATCGTCSGGPSFSGCYQPSTENAPPCPGYPCLALCSSLPEGACLARMDCRADYCSGCQTKTFAQCARATDPPPVCPALKCVAACDAVTTLADCEVRTDCHSVFVDPGTCGCAVAGCCAKFSRCADGDKAMCTGMPLCKIATPFCELPYVVSYTGSCYEGCVKKTDCAP